MSESSWTREDLFARLFVLRAKATARNVHMACQDSTSEFDWRQESDKLVFNAWVWEQIQVPATVPPDVALEEFIVTRILWQAFNLQYGKIFDLSQAFEWFNEHVGGLQSSSITALAVEQIEHEIDQREQDIVALKKDYDDLLNLPSKEKVEPACNIEETIALVHKHKRTIRELQLRKEPLIAESNKIWGELKAAIESSPSVEDLQETVIRLYPEAQFHQRPKKKRKRE